MLTDEQREELVDRYLNTDDTVQKIITDFGTHPTLFYEVLREAGVQPNRERGRKCSVSTEAIVEAYLGAPETPVKEIANNLGVSVSLLYNRLTRAGVEKNGMRKHGPRRMRLPVEELWKEYDAGVSMEDLAERHGVHQSTIRRRLQEAGYETQRGVLKKVLPVEEIVFRYKNGESLRQIAEDYPVSHETIRKRLLDAGVDTRDRSCGDNTKSIPTEEVAEKHYAGARTSELADEYGASDKTLRRRLRESGYEVKRYGPPKLDLPVEKMAEDYRQGLSLSDLAEKYPASIMTIRRRLIEAGVKIRPPYRHNGGGNGNSDGERSLVQSQGTST